MNNARRIIEVAEKFENTAHLDMRVKARISSPFCFAFTTSSQVLGEIYH